MSKKTDYYKKKSSEIKTNLINNRSKDKNEFYRDIGKFWGLTDVMISDIEKYEKYENKTKTIAKIAAVLAISSVIYKKVKDTTDKKRINEINKRLREIEDELKSLNPKHITKIKSLHNETNKLKSELLKIYSNGKYS